MITLLMLHVTGQTASPLHFHPSLWCHIWRVWELSCLHLQPPKGVDHPAETEGRSCKTKTTVQVRVTKSIHDFKQHTFSSMGKHNITNHNTAKGAHRLPVVMQLTWDLSMRAIRSSRSSGDGRLSCRPLITPRYCAERERRYYHIDIQPSKYIF